MLARLCYKPNEYCWFDLTLFLIWEQFQADVAEFIRDYPLASLSEELERDIAWIEKAIFPELAATPRPERLLEDCLAANILSTCIEIENERNLMLGILSYDLLCGSIEKVLL
jgi:hypothetical protein